MTDDERWGLILAAPVWALHLTLWPAWWAIHLASRTSFDTTVTWIDACPLLHENREMSERAA